MFAIIGGSGLSRLSTLDVVRREIVRTPYGIPSGPIIFGELCGKPVMFLARHGFGHTIPPHLVNYRANIWALREAGASAILSVASVGGIRSDLKPGTLIVPHQIIDYTWGRSATFFDRTDEPVRHIDFTHPYNADLRQHVLDCAERTGEAMIDGSVYAATQGPRLETAAEIDRFERDGADVVGMTGMPEASLAREINLPYAAINIVANFAAGRGDSVERIAFQNIEKTLTDAMERVRKLLDSVCRE